MRRETPGKFLCNSGFKYALFAIFGLWLSAAVIALLVENGDNKTKIMEIESSVSTSIASINDLSTDYASLTKAQRDLTTQITFSKAATDATLRSLNVSISLMSPSTLTTLSKNIANIDAIFMNITRQVDYVQNLSDNLTASGLATATRLVSINSTLASQITSLSTINVVLNTSISQLVSNVTTSRDNLVSLTSTTTLINSTLSSLSTSILPRLRREHGYHYNPLITSCIYVTTATFNPALISTTFAGLQSDLCYVLNLTSIVNWMVPARSTIAFQNRVDNTEPDFPSQMIIRRIYFVNVGSSELNIANSNVAPLYSSQGGTVTVDPGATVRLTFRYLEVLDQSTSLLRAPLISWKYDYDWDV